MLRMREHSVAGLLSSPSKARTGRRLIDTKLVHCIKFNCSSPTPLTTEWLKMVHCQCVTIILTAVSSWRTWVNSKSCPSLLGTYIFCTNFIYSPDKFLLGGVLLLRFTRAVFGSCVHSSIILSSLPFHTPYIFLSRVKNCGMNFDWSLFEFTARDSQLLASGLKATPTLRVFRLNRSKVGDQKGRLIISHLLDHPSLSVLGVYMGYCT